MFLAHPRARPGRLVRAALSAAALAIAAAVATGPAEAAPQARAAGHAGAESAANTADAGMRVEVDHRHYRKGGKHRSWKKRHWKRDGHYGKRHGYYGQRHGHHWKKRWHHGKRHYAPRRHGGYVYRFGSPDVFGFYYAPKRDYRWRRHH